MVIINLFSVDVLSLSFTNMSIASIVSHITRRITSLSLRNPGVLTIPTLITRSSSLSSCSLSLVPWLPSIIPSTSLSCLLIPSGLLTFLQITHFQIRSKPLHLTLYHLLLITTCGLSGGIHVISTHVLLCVSVSRQLHSAWLVLHLCFMLVHPSKGSFFLIEIIFGISGHSFDNITLVNDLFPKLVSILVDTLFVGSIFQGVNMTSTSYVSRRLLGRPFLFQNDSWSF